MNFWDEDASEQTASSGEATNQITGKTTEEMKTQATFTSWDFTTVWSMTATVNAGYPHLAWQQDPIEVTATSGTPGPTNYTSLYSAFSAINAGTHKGAITIKIKDNTTETSSAVLYASGTEASSYISVNIYPTVTGLTISGSIANSALIDLEGADNVTINGSLNQGNSAADLTISNTNTSDGQTSTIYFTADAQNNTVKYCTIKGSSTSTSSGTVYFSNSATVGNDNNILEYNNFTNAGGRPYNSIIHHSSSIAGSSNDGNIIRYNNFFDFMNLSTANTSCGILINDYSNSVTIQGNNFYETSSYAPVSTATFSAIYAENVHGNYITISGNYIGGSSAGCGGTFTKTIANNNIFYGIYINAGAVTASDVQGNTIKNIAWSNSGSSSFYGIYVEEGTVNIGTTTANTIGASTGTGSITYINTNAVSGGKFYGIFSGGTAVKTISNNVIRSITTGNAVATYNTDFCGISTSEAGNCTISGNTIGSTTEANSINLSSASTGVAQTGYGIYVFSSGTNSITGNIIANMTNGTTNETGSRGSVIGLYYSGGTSGTNVVSKNFIHSLSSASASLYGIKINSGATTYSNNIISLGGNTATDIYGIYQTGTTGNNNNLYFNTVYIGGSTTSSLRKSYSLYSAGSLNIRDFRNNIFMNARSTTEAKDGNYNYAMYIASTGGTLFFDYNDYYVTGARGVLGYYNGTDQEILPIVPGQNVHSLAISPSFTGAGGTDVANYKPGVSTLAGVTGTGILLDYSGWTRPTGSAPTMGAIEHDNPLPVSLSSFSSNISGRNVKLNWITASEQNNSGFNIERKSITGDFAKIGFVNGKGTTNTPSSYSFEDRNMQTGKYQYRLKQIDNNGNFEFHNLNGTIEVGIPNKFDLSQNYPNPFNPVTKINFDLPSDSKISLVIYDVTGREVAKFFNNELRTAGYYTIDFNGSSMASGIYFYRFIAESAGKQTVISKRMALIK